MSPERNPLRRLGKAVALHNMRWLKVNQVVESAEALWARPSHRGLRWRLPALGIATAIFVVGGAVALWLLPRRHEDRGPAGAPPAATFWVRDRPGSLGQWLVADGAAEMACRFPDGTSVLARPGTRLRVRGDTARPTTVEVERGRIAVSVPHRPDVTWRFEVGPFDLRVTGTRFDASWDPELELFELLMHDGSVETRGPTLGAGRTVVAGQQLRLQVRAASPPDAGGGLTVPLSTLPMATVPSFVPGAQADAAEPGSTGNGPSVVPGSANAEPASNWRNLAAGGRYAEALAQIEALGFDRVQASAAAANMLLLGDVARLAGRPERARGAYLTMRQRFFTDPSKAQAAFALGLLAFPGPAAASWFETYLAESPSGPLAREALGRLLEVHHRTGDPTAALEEAERYLAQYPGGPHADLARSVLSGPR